MIKVVDKATGEYIEFDFKDWTDFATQYDGVNQQIKALERAKKKMQETIKLEMGDDKMYDAGAGWRFERQERSYMNYDVTTLRRFLDEDQLSLIMKPDKKKVDEFLGLWLEEGAIDAESKKQIKANMITERGSVSAITLMREGGK